MSIPDSLFMVFSALLLLSGMLVVSAKNPVHAVLFLVLGFFNAAGLFLLLGAEFLAMLLVVVYVGAVMVLFLFVVMMLDVNFAAMRRSMTKHLPLGLAVGGIILAELLVTIFSWQGGLLGQNANAPMPNPNQIDNTKALGLLLYTDYAYLFEGAGLILLVAMVGAIVLTLRRRDGVKRQIINDQLARRGSDEITLHSGN